MRLLLPLLVVLRKLINFFQVGCTCTCVCGSSLPPSHSQGSITCRRHLFILMCKNHASSWQYRVGANTPGWSRTRRRKQKYIFRPCSLYSSIQLHVGVCAGVMWTTTGLPPGPWPQSFRLCPASATEFWLPVCLCKCVFLIVRALCCAVCISNVPLLTSCAASLWVVAASSHSTGK